ncbi:hypothetical protein Avbf_11314 [Armadillidium vulgare]|nr:hypothetical protein Avbf_11314 [Armadillidium vulgare]
MDLWGQEWEVLKTLLELNLIKNVHQLTFSSHFSFLKALDVGNWRNTLQDIMDTMTQMEEQGLLKTLYRETRNSLSSILLPGDDVPRPGLWKIFIPYMITDNILVMMLEGYDRYIKSL